MKKSLLNFIVLLLSFLWINNTNAFIVTNKPVNIKNNNSLLSLFPDSLSKAKEDSVRLYKLSLDSTARIEQFKFKQTPQQTINVIPKRKYPLLSYPPQGVFQRTVKMDSTGQFIIITEKVGDYELKPSLKIPIEQFIELKKASANRKLMEELGLKYEMKQKGDDLGNLFKDLTNIVIPLPSSDVFSIFGPNKIELSVSGSVNILGAWKTEKTDGITTALNQNEQSAPDFKQQVQINVTGKIGDKLSILADWNTERQFDFENQLKINYKGYDDEIIQSIEAGNVTLQGSPLIGGSEALFGIKANLKFGPFTLTAIASQKKSEAQELSISGGAASRTFEIRPNKYSENHFFVDKIYTDTDTKRNIFNKYYGESTPIRDDTVRYYEIKEIEVYKSDYRQGSNGVAEGFRASAFIDLKAKSRANYGKRNFYENEIRDSISINGEEEVRQNFSKLNPGTDYTINMNTGHLTIKTSLQPNDVIAVAYRIEGATTGNDDDIYYGEFESEVLGVINDIKKEPRILKLVRPKNLQPKFQKAWQLQLKNIYSLGASKLSETGFKFEIKYEMPTGEPIDNINGKKLLEKFELDKSGPGGSPQPDGVFDFKPQRTIIPETGEIIFPVLKPFSAKYIGNQFELDEATAKQYAYEQIYDSSQTVAAYDKIHDKFKFTGEYSAASSSTFSLGRTNVVENSVKVLLNGRQLVEGKDYVVDYLIGQVTIKNSEALNAGSNLQIKFEENDMFTLASKTLFGLRGVYTLNKETSMGFTFMNLSQKTLSDKIRVGEEPISNSMWGIDFKTKFDLPFLTKAIDYLFPTAEMSSISLSGEFAYMDPDPNTKKSNIGGDEGKNIAYIDDFEGAKKLVPLPVALGSWKDISAPFDNMPAKMPLKGKSYWFNVQQIKYSDLYGNRKKTSSRDNNFTALSFNFLTNKPGQYNTSPKIGNTSELKKQAWGGMMTRLSSVASNLQDDNIEYLEMWIYISKPANTSSAVKPNDLIIDLGQISEDIIPNGTLDTEDKNFNKLLDEGEDTGLDGILDDIEKQKYNSNLEDPANDNWALESGYSFNENMNNTQGNSKFSDNGRLPDTEDLDGLGSLDNVNSYFRYNIPLDTSSANPYRISKGPEIRNEKTGKSYKWIQVRIPLNKSTSTIGNPSLKTVETIRFWITNSEEDTVSLAFADMNLVGNQWIKVKGPGINENDEVLKLATISFEENPNYEMPPGVSQEKDRQNTSEDVYKNEQALEIRINKLQDGDKREIIKNINGKPLDVFNYKEMKLFIHGDKSDGSGSVSNYIDENNYSSEVYLRFGTDTNHFYEYRQPVRSGWNEVKIVFADLTALKQGRDDTQKRNLVSAIVPGFPGHKIGVKGDPSLISLKFITFGVINPPDKGVYKDAVTGNIWVNELRVLEADNSKGIAYNMTTNLKMADLLNLNFTFSKQDPFFHKLNDRFGTRNDSRTWSLNGTLDIMKMLPVKMPGSKLSLSFTHTEQFGAPLYIPGTDIKIDKAIEKLEEDYIKLGRTPAEAKALALDEKIKSESMSVMDQISLMGIQFKIPSKEWYIEQTINNLIFNFSYNKSYSRNPTTQKSNNWSWKSDMNYRAAFSNENYFKFADIPLLGYLFEWIEDYKDAKFYYTPQNFDFSISLERKRDYSKSRTVDIPSIIRDFRSTRGMGFDWMFTDMGIFNLKLKYTAAAMSTYADKLIENRNNIIYERKDSEVWADIFKGYLFGTDLNFSQDFLLTMNPRLPSILDLNKYVNLTLSYGSRYDWSNNIQQKHLGYAAKYANKIDIGLRIELSKIGDAIFGNNTKVTEPKQRRRGEKTKEVSQEGENKDNKTANVEESEPEEENSEPFYITGLTYMKEGIKWLLFDYRQISINFSQTNSNIAGGLRATNTGFSNFWGFKQDENSGPTRSFMLGLSNSVGKRAAKANILDSYTRNNSIDITTSKELWTDARLDINFKVGWGFQQTINIETEETGEIRTIKIQSFNENLDRSFWTFPFVGNKIQKLTDSYTIGKNDTLASKFVEAFEDFRIFGSFFKDIMRYIPRPNWKFTWGGLEKISFLSGVLSRLSINHAYSSTYQEIIKGNPDGNKEYQSQRVAVNFSPLVGVSFTLKKYLDGLTGTFNYNVRNNYDMNFGGENLTESNSNDINFTTSYTKSGFDIPLFGLSLKNDITASFSYTLSKTSKTMFYLNYNKREQLKKEGNALSLSLDGTTRIVIEPSIRYVMSSKVTTKIFYKRTTIDPEGRSSMPKTITNEFGLDVNILIN